MTTPPPPPPPRIWYGLTPSPDIYQHLSLFDHKPPYFLENCPVFYLIKKHFTWLRESFLSLNIFFSWFKEFCMKNKFFTSGMLAVTLGLIFIGCENGNNLPPPSPPPPPVEIDTLEGLLAIGANTGNLSKNYILTADITGPVTTPIGTGPFIGDFDGNGHSITMTITDGPTFSISGYSGTYAGLFAGIGPGGSVHDLTVGGTVTITNSANQLVVVGGVAGGLLPGASISNVESSVAVTVTSSGNGDVIAGGIAGGVQAGTVRNSHATGNVSATSTAASGDINVNAGGVVGNFHQSGEVSHTVALNTSVGISGGSGTKVAQRVIGRHVNSGGTMAYNYGNEASQALMHISHALRHSWRKAFCLGEMLFPYG
jgi:hypothetical protein